MNTKQFHIGDILSITTGRMLSLRRVDGVCSILKFITGDSLFCIQFMQSIDHCRPILVEQFPQFAETEMGPALKELDDLLKPVVDRGTAEEITTYWLTRQAAKYGEVFVVNTSPRLYNTM